MSLSSPMAGSLLIEGIPFQVDWVTDGTPNTAGDGTMDIVLVTDVSASTVAAQLDSNVSPLALSTSATVPLDVTCGMYYLQLKVTSGSEHSMVTGPLKVVNGLPSNITVVTSSTPSSSSSHTSATLPMTSANSRSGSGSSVKASFIGAIIGACILWLVSTILVQAL